MKALWNALYKLDVQANYKLLNGNEGETISSRLGRKIERDDCVSCRVFCRVVLFPLAVLLRNKHFKHCRDSIQEEYRE